MGECGWTMKFELPRKQVWWRAASDPDVTAIVLCVNWLLIYLSGLLLQKSSMLIVTWKQVCEVGIIHPFYLWGCWGSEKLSPLLWSLSSEGGLDLEPRFPRPCRNLFPFCCLSDPLCFQPETSQEVTASFPPHSRILVRVARLSLDRSQ